MRKSSSTRCSRAGPPTRSVSRRESPPAYPHLRHLVFSTKLRHSHDPSVELTATDPLATVRDLKAEEGLDVWIVGGGTLAHALLPEIARIVLKQDPAAIGSGVPMFNGPFQPHMFRPSEARERDSVVRILSFDRTLSA